MNSFNTQIQCDEITDSRPTAADWAEYCEWLDSQESAESDSVPEPYEWSEEAISWEDGFHPDNLYDQD